MPTYALRTGITGTVTESGVTIGSTSTAVPTVKVLTEAILTFTDSSSYAVGELITEATSGITGRLYWNDNMTLGVIEASGEFTGGEVITGATSGTTETPTGVLNQLERTLTTPRLFRILHQHALSGDAVSPQTVYIDRETKWFLILDVSGAALTLNSASVSYPIIDVPENTPVTWKNEQQINPLVIEFADTATATLYEFDIDSNPLTDNTLMLAVGGGGGISSSASGSAIPLAEYTSPDDFTAAYTSADTITLTSPPTITDDSQIVYIKVIPASGLAAIYVNGDGTITIREAANILTITGVATPFTAGDVYEVGINGDTKAYDATLNAYRVTGGSSSVSAEYLSPDDFTAAYTSADTLTLTSPPTITDDSQIVYIKVIPASGTAATYVNGDGTITIREAANVLTITGIATPFTAGDVYEVGINGATKAYDGTNDLLKVQEQSPVWERYTDAVTLEGTPQDLTANWADYGSEISMQGFSRLGLFLTLDINDSLNVRVRVLAKHTNAGAEEYNLPIKTVSSTDVKIEPEYIEFNTDADQLVILEVDTNLIVPICQVQISAGTAGATEGQFDASYITKGYV